MQYFYSASKNGFYIDIREKVYRAAGNWPDDLLPVQTADYLSFINPLPGMRLAPDAKGKPTLIAVRDESQAKGQESGAVE